MAGGLPTTKEELDKGCSEMRPNVEKVGAKISECKQKVDDVHEPSGWERAGEALFTVMFPVAGFYFGWRDLERIIASQPEVRQKLDEAGKGIADMMVEVIKLTSPGNPFAMKGMADEWDKVNRLLTGTVEAIDAGRFAATMSWTDSLGQRYAKVPGVQKAALAGAIPLVTNMAGYLRAQSASILKAWWDVVEKIADFVIEGIQVAAKFISANPINWLDKAQDIAAAIATVLRAIKDLVKIAVEYGMKSQTELEKFKSAASNVTGTDFGKWPTALLA